MANQVLIVALKFLQRWRSRGTAESSGLGFQYSVACDRCSYHGNHSHQKNHSSERKIGKREETTRPGLGAEVVFGCRDGYFSKIDTYGAVS